jgi:CRISPR-associated endonuclease Csn1
MKKILGLDLGTNSIGWALIRQDFDNKLGNIEGLGSRIIPMTQDVLGKFDSGVSISQTAERTGYRSVRRLNQRQLLRRERLHRVLNILGFLPPHYSDSIDFEKHFGQFKAETETKLVYKQNKSGKYQFLFQETFNEMVADFKANGIDDLKIPYDWTIYYLRQKALTKKISKEELAWLLLNFNQKRGYYQLRGEEEETETNKSIEFHSLKVIEVTPDELQKGKNEIWYNIILENGWIYRRSSKIALFNWVDKTKEFIVTTELNDDGTVKTDKEGKERRSFKAVDSEKDWIAIKKKTELDIENSKQTVGCFIYDTLLKNPTQKINGKLVRTIERKFYKQELEQILKIQIAFHTELEDRNRYQQCIDELYKNNEAHKSNIKNRGFDYLFLNDIIFYQRPLKSKISLISDCSLESRTFAKDGKLQTQTIKCIAKSHPLFQEFRLWQFIQNLKIYKKDIRSDVDVSSEYLQTEDEIVKLFEALNNKKDITQKQFLAIYKLKEEAFRWNFVEDKTYPCNETRHQFLSKTAKIEGMNTSFFNTKNSEDLWHILYSVTDKIEIENAIKKFTDKHNLPDEFAKIFSNLPPYKNEYGAYSAKAIKKLLPLMRMGNYWNETAIDPRTQERIDKILTGEYDENMPHRVREHAEHLTNVDHFKGLPLWLTSYIVYDRHSESNDLAKWKTPADIEWYLNPKNPNGFKQHSLRNPIVEQVITETLRVVTNIWQEYGDGAENFFNEIHIELGREMKNPADKRKRMTEQISQNENTNIRVKALLDELKNGGINEIRPYSPSQQEILKIFEEGVYSNENSKNELDVIDKIRKNSKPSRGEIQRYKLWLEQGYISPYTGAIIKLSELFSTKYQIEHIFPQSRFFDDSMVNKVICESEVNQLKDNMTAFEFILKHKGEKVPLNGGKTVTILMTEEYEEHIKKYFAKNKTKQKNLLSAEIPESFINRQLNDSRYISKVVKNLLSKIVREEKEGQLEQETTSKNIVPITGAITSKMKQDWGLNDVWNEIITPRFERLNEMTASKAYGDWELKKSENDREGKHVFQTMVPDEIAKGFSKKRIDHRHHALDALVIACVSRTHNNYLNNLNAKDADDKSIKHELRNKICFKTKPDDKGNYKWLFHKPWNNFTVDAKNQLFETIVSFKQNTRIINKTVNKFQKFIPDANGIMKKEIVMQSQGENWAIRKPLHKETVYGKVFLKREKENEVPITTALHQIENIVDLKIKNIVKAKARLYNNDIEQLNKYFKKNPIEIEGKTIIKLKVYETVEATASRTKLDNTFDEKKIKSITDLGIQQILLNHLKQEKFQNQTDENGKTIAPQELAFSEDGLEDMNRNIKALNNGKDHQPIVKVRTYEKGNRFAIGQTGNKKDKFVEGAKGTNLFFAVYQDEKGKRNYETIPLNEAIEAQKKGLSIAKETDTNGNKLLFVLSPNDLVYIPTLEEQENPHHVNFENLTKEQVDRVYKMVSFSGNQAFFILNSIATSIVDKKEFSVLNKMEKDINGNMIKSICWKLKINRLGKIIKTPNTVKTLEMVESLSY